MRFFPLLVLLLAACAAIRSRTATARPVAKMTVTDMDGARHEVAAGRPVALVFWSTWCTGCIEEAPAVAAAARAHADSLLFLGVVPGPDDVVDDEEVRATAKTLDLPYPQVRDRDLALSRRFDVEGTPTIVLLDAGGRVTYSGHEVPDRWVNAE